MTTQVRTTRVAVLGLGQMGTAMARVLIDAGHEVTVWNRTPSKADPFTATAHVADSVAGACRSAEVVISVLASYEVADRLLSSGNEDALRGKTLVQMATGTPNDVRGTARWADQMDVSYLDAKVVAYPNSVGTEHSTILYSGSSAAFERWLPALAPLAGRSEFVGEVVSDAATLDLAWLGFWYGASASFMQSLALCRSENLSVDHLLSRLRWMVDFVESSARDAAARVESGDFGGEDCSLVVHNQALMHVVRACGDAGLNVGLPASVVAVFDRAIALGYGSDELPALHQALSQLAPE